MLCFTEYSCMLQNVMVLQGPTPLSPKMTLSSTFQVKRKRGRWLSGPKSLYLPLRALDILDTYGN